MTIEVNDCVCCGLPCLGDSCPNRHASHKICDKCGTDLGDHFVVGGEEFCQKCFDRTFPKIETKNPGICSRCGCEDYVFRNIDGDKLCQDCVDKLYGKY